MQLGNADASEVFNADIGGFENAVAGAAGGAHSCTLLADGRVFCWGSNDLGQLGNGTRNDSATPVQVARIVTAVAISTIRDHNCALLASGAVVCWGRNDFGQVDGTLGGDRLVATPVSTIAAGEAVAVATGFQHSCILTVAGRVRCWGRNNEGQLGNNTLNNSLAPVNVLRQAKEPALLTDVVGLVSDAAHNCALRTTGQPLCWGRNPEGQLGDGTRTRRLLAVGVGSFSANVAKNAELAANNRVAKVTALVNCPEGEHFTGDVTVMQGAVSARRPFNGKCVGGLSEYPLVLPIQGRDSFTIGEAVAELEILVANMASSATKQQWTRRIVLVDPAP